MAHPDLVGAVVWCFEKSMIYPGDQTRAVITPGTSEFRLSLWRSVNVGDELAMHEGLRVCGHARVRWTRETAFPFSAADEDSFREWCAGGLSPDHQ